MTGLVSTALEQEVLSEVRRHGVVVWLDAASAYTPFTDALGARHTRGESPFPVVRFRGSFLDVLFQLEPYAAGLDGQHVLVHVPGFDAASIRKTPVLAMYEAGAPFERSLEALIRETATSRVAPSEVAAFLATGPSLEAADTWLASAVSVSSGGLAAVLREAGASMVADALAEKPGAALSSRVAVEGEVETLRAFLLAHAGMDDAWAKAFARGENTKPLDGVLFAFVAWVLCVEYVHDLRRPPSDPRLERLRSLTAPLVQACSEHAARLRRDAPEVYARRADEVEGMFREELSAMTPEDLGDIDTFREEENRVLEGAVRALCAGDFARAMSWCTEREGGKSFWRERDQGHRFAWSLVQEAALFGTTLGRHPRPFEGMRTLEEATEHYATFAFEVDRAHRRFEQERLRRLTSTLPHFGALQEVTSTLRKAHRAYADTMTRDFNALCQAHGFLPSASMQQRNLFEQVVHPLTTSGEKVAFFLIDAFRFEMATELVDALRSKDTVVELKPRLCELPSITAVGMNVLAPVAKNDKLHVAGVFQGFKTGEFTVRGPADRARAMGLRSVGRAAHAMTLAAVCEATTTALVKETKPHTLIVVHSKEIDDAGEANVGIPTFESTLEQIKSAWHHLQLAGVKHFVFTADHGFLLEDETTETRPFGTKRDPSRRHVFDPYARAEPGMVNVSLSSLGYEGISGYLLFSDDTARFATGVTGSSFAHGGNSPQERIIPVLTVTRERAEKGSLSEYAVEVQPLETTSAGHSLEVRVVFPRGTTTSLGFVAARYVELAIRVPRRDNVRVIVKEVSQPATHHANRIQIPVSDVWTKVYFGLEGPTDERVRVELYHPDGVETVKPASPDTWFAVAGTVQSRARPKSAPPTRSTLGVDMPAATSGEWTESIEDPLIRKVFLHIEKHGVITEVEAIAMLGNARQFRRFSHDFDTYKDKVPFRVRIDATDGGKRYVREGDR